jgi:hypothetical protein
MDGVVLICHQSGGDLMDGVVLICHQSGGDLMDGVVLICQQSGGDLMDGVVLICHQSGGDLMDINAIAISIGNRLLASQNHRLCSGALLHVADLGNQPALYSLCQQTPAIVFLLLARQVRATFASDSRLWRESGVNLAHMSRKCYAQTSRTMCVMLPAFIMQMLRAHSAAELLLDPSVVRYWLRNLWRRTTSSSAYWLKAYTLSRQEVGIWCGPFNIGFCVRMRNRFPQK